MDKIVLTLNGAELDLTDDKYTESYSAVDNVNVSEAGTNLRAVVRTHIPTLSVSYTCTAGQKALLDGFNRASSLLCTKWSEEDSGETLSWVCYMANYTADLVVETPTTRFYKVSFKLIDLES